MKKRVSLVHPLVIFILMQITWLSLLGLWIYWYVLNYTIVEQAGERIIPQFLLSPTSTQMFALIIGLTLLIFLLIGMYFVFIYLTRQININRLYENFIANFTHELKSPLASIQLYVETLQKRRVDEETRKQFLANMMDDIHRLKRIIDNILDISQIEQNKKLYHFKHYSAQPFLKELLNECKKNLKISDDQIKIKGRVKGYVLADREALGMVFTNLIDNARKYSPKGLDLTISLRSESNRLIIDFQDKGMGIPFTEQPFVFQKFYRVQSKDSPNVQGTGLGLYLAREILRAHEGKLEVSSPGPGKGSTFRVVLPLTKTIESEEQT